MGVVESRLDGSEPREDGAETSENKDGPETLGERNQAGASWTVASSEWLHSFRPKMVVGFYYFPL